MTASSHLAFTIAALHDVSKASGQSRPKVVEAELSHFPPVPHFRTTRAALFPAPQRRQEQADGEVTPDMETQYVAAI